MNEFRKQGWYLDYIGYRIIIPDFQNIRHFQYRSQDQIESPTLNAQIVVVANIAAVYLEKLLTC